MSNSNPIHVVLFEPEIPQNTGNIGRTCVALGAKLWLVRPLGFRLDDRYLSRAGLDYWQYLDWEVVDDWVTLDKKLPTLPQRRWYLSKKATKCYTTAKFESGDALIFGSETNGLPPTLLQSSGSQALTIPMRPEVRSLNLAASAAVVGYEMYRQLTVGPG